MPSGRALRPPLTGHDVLLWSMSEPQWQQQVLEWAARGGWKSYHTHDSRRSPSGFPDLVLTRPGREVIFAELKTMKGVESKAQREWIDALNVAVGCRAYLWRPSDWREVKDVLVLSQLGTTFTKR